MAGMYSEKCILRQNHCTSTIGGSQSFVASGRYPDMWCWCNKTYCFTISFSEYFYIVGIQSKTRGVISTQSTKSSIMKSYVLYIVIRAIYSSVWQGGGLTCPSVTTCVDYIPL